MCCIVLIAGWGGRKSRVQLVCYHEKRKRNGFFHAGISLEDLRCKVDAVKAEISALGYNTSFGIAVHEREGIDMVKLVRTAEMEMYVEKQEYYSQKTHDRRRSRIRE